MEKIVLLSFPLPFLLTKTKTMKQALFIFLFAALALTSHAQQGQPGTRTVVSRGMVYDSAGKLQVDNTGDTTDQLINNGKPLHVWFVVIRCNNCLMVSREGYLSGTTSHTIYTDMKNQPLLSGVWGGKAARVAQILFDDPAPTQ